MRRRLFGTLLFRQIGLRDLSPSCMQRHWPSSGKARESPTTYRFLPRDGSARVSESVSHDLMTLRKARQSSLPRRGTVCPLISTCGALLCGSTRTDVKLSHVSSMLSHGLGPLFPAGFFFRLIRLCYERVSNWELEASSNAFFSETATKASIVRKDVFGRFG